MICMLGICKKKMKMNKVSVAIILMTSIIARIESTATANKENDIANRDEASLGFEEDTFSQGNDERCHRDNDCGNNRDCDDGRCKCKFGFDSVTGECVEATRCQRDSDCGGNGECDDGRCECKNGFDLTGKCAERCHRDIDCGANGECDDGRCDCKNGFDFVDRNCVVNDIANRDEASFGFESDNTLSQGNQERCHRDSDCGNNRDCDDGRCKCKFGFDSVTGECVEATRCQRDSDCGGNGECDDGRCKCKNGFDLTGNCAERCHRDIDCGANGECDDGRCDCKKGFDFVDRNCVVNDIANRDEASFGFEGDNTFSQGNKERCRRDSDCGHNRDCDDGRCKCKSGIDSANGECVVQCHRDSDCGDNGECDDGRCECINGFDSTGKCAERCHRDSDCGFNGECDDGRCEGKNSRDFQSAAVAEPRSFYHENEGRCDVLYGDKCYVLIVGRMNLGEAKSACKAAKGKLANIYSEEHFELIRALLRSRIPTNSNYINAWLGMTIDLSTRRVKLSNGDWAPYSKWYPYRPHEEPRPYVGMRCYHLNDHHQGYIDNWASAQLWGAVCEA